MGVLIGDATGNGIVNSADVMQTQTQSGQSVSANTFREDLTANGLINSDVTLARTTSATALPNSPQGSDYL